MTILLTGGTGFLGSHIAELLSKRGQKLRALVRTTSDTRHLETLGGVELVEGAVEDKESLVDAAQGVTAIIHAAGLIKAKRPEDFHRINVGGTENALAAARAAGPELKRFVLVSSIAAAGPSDAAGTPVTADGPARPVTHYGRSKLGAERAALATKDQVPVTILRPPVIYGARDREFLAIFKAVNSRVLPYTGSARNRVSVIYGPDAAAACVAAVDAEVPSGSTYFIDDGIVYSVEELATQVEAALGKRAWLRVPLPKILIRGAALFSELYGKATDKSVLLTRDKCNELFEQWVCDSAPARADLGWQPEMTFPEGARVTADWYREAGWL